MKNKNRKIQIGVIGPAESEYPKDTGLKNKICEFAEKIGELLAEKDAVVFTGGTDGVMELVSRGAKKKNGTTVGTPGRTRNSSNKYIDIEVLTPIDVGDFLFAGILSSDAIITIPGGAGTMAELCLAYRFKKPIIVIEGLDNNYDKLINNYLDESKLVLIEGAKNPEEAVEKAIASIHHNNSL
ncbi:MAG: hypothetical protein A2998_00365 [Candidatus Staskawiczbacteria bacterium RIFCSPLOWO2_01_FULL_37_25b]|uniref:TIGR00725 family protein n=2 Tax=Candidatus Staskawicziibacteriota TaxID=1817916 RepID=A0A1G2HP77_9BACT|nr:MAG: hypothetical protein A2812_03495 [Candidatus Staskawiczbacteria bacterium RIFCSPHIGHO2_01_FULL_36_16]OGZ71676.1 MAG: hypothetical protein A2998_00365 [Candidatus Staskawiczbacteria bacterium RIFCSPLOWO2_01_FULL_37_25b]